MNVIFEICDWRDYNPLEGEFNPKGFDNKIIETESRFRLNQVIRPFLQSYEYLVIGCNPIYGVVKIIPHCNFAKEVFKMQYEKQKNNN
jgi:hypothetical protein